MDQQTRVEQQQAQLSLTRSHYPDQVRVSRTAAAAAAATATVSTEAVVVSPDVHSANDGDDACEPWSQIPNSAVHQAKRRD